MTCKHTTQQYFTKDPLEGTKHILMTAQHITGNLICRDNELGLWQNGFMWLDGLRWRMLVLYLTMQEIM